MKHVNKKYEKSNQKRFVEKTTIKREKKSKRDKKTKKGKEKALQKGQGMVI